MPSDPLRFPYRNELAMPVIGLEAEFKVFVDDAEVVPEEYWRTPDAFIARPLVRRSTRSVQLPTGGALYFDGGVLEVVTPVIEIAPQCTGRVVRSLWEQIGFVRDELDTWERREGVAIRLQAYSCHFNISFELERAARGRNRTIQKLAVLLAHLLPLPVIVLGANRRSTGVGVRPRRDRIEITLDFTPDPGLMDAAAALIVGVVRDVIEWPSYLIADAERAGIPLIAGLEPGRHPTRKGWIARREHFPADPFDTDLDDERWLLCDDRTLSLRRTALEIAQHFQRSITRWADPFSVRLLFSILRGETAALLDLPDRPAEYDDIGRTIRWGTTLRELENFAPLMNDSSGDPQPRRRKEDVDEKLAPPWSGEATNRRRRTRKSERRASSTASTARRLTRSSYESVFLKLGAGRPLRIDGELLTPVAVQGWYHAIFRDERGEERLFSIDQLLEHLASFE